MEIISSQPFWYVFMGSMTVSPSPHRHLERSCLSVVEQRVLSARGTLSLEISCRYAACTIHSSPFFHHFIKPPPVHQDLPEIVPPGVLCSFSIFIIASYLG